MPIFPSEGTLVNPREEEESQFSSFRWDIFEYLVLNNSKNYIVKVYAALGRLEMQNLVLLFRIGVVWKGSGTTLLTVHQN